jgi:hypothetical protein
MADSLSTTIVLLCLFIAIVNLFMVTQISRLPDSQHRFKRFWIRIILLLPVFGVMMFLLFAKQEVIGK